jgi:hypothetical protein
LSNTIDIGIPNRGMISFNRHLDTSQAFSVQVGKVSTHSEKLQANTSKYLHHLTCGISVKSTSGFQKEFFQHFIPGVVLLALVGDSFWHTDCTFHILSYLCGRVWWHKNVGSRWSFMELLDKCGS